MSEGKPKLRDTGQSREAPSLIRNAPYKGGDSRISDRPSALPADLRTGLEEKARELGFCAIGFARADAAPASGERLRQWLADGAHGDMIWMEETADRRASPAGLWPDVRSVISLGMSYAPAHDPLALAERPEVGRISVYAQGADYHDTVKKALKALARWLVDEAGCDLKLFVDTAPVMEKPLAEAAGLGWQGKHTNLVSRTDGSWLFLGAIYTTLELEETPAPHARHCGSCRACLDICPTDAFPAPYRLDARRCISYLTIEHKGPIPEEFRAAIGNRVYGCDDCLAVCPWNRFADSARANRAFLPRAELAAPRLADLLALDDSSFRKIFAGSPIKRIGRGRMVRNAAIAAGNSGRPELAPALERLTGDEDPVVAEAAAWGLARLSSPSKMGRGTTRRVVEG
jgi:epoxyqueuosine reductase